MRAQNTDVSTVSGRELTHKPRALIFASEGFFPALKQNFREKFELLDLVNLRYPRIYSAFFLLRSFRFSKDAWYREWKRCLEHIPFSFKLKTKMQGRYLQKLNGEYDLCLFLGATSAPGESINKPLFLFTDSCRWLSSNNKFDELAHFRSKKERDEWLALEGDVYRRASRIFVGSNFVKSALVSAYSVEANRIVVVGFGAGVGFAQSNPSQKQFDSKSILYIGKGDFEKKGGLVLLKAFERVRGKRPDAILHIVGQDRVPPTEGVINHGYMSDRNRIVTLMNEAHVFVLPSLVDRFGITLVEAMATGTPCVCSDYGAMPEIIGDAGLVAPAGDDELLADALLKILSDASLAKTLGSRGRKRYEDIYNWNRIWKVMYAEMLQVLDEWK
jgi:glycosyltransferase involved in cell wall biosynthesis